jgi:hypothetical protein
MKPGRGREEEEQQKMGRERVKRVRPAVLSIF